MHQDRFVLNQNSKIDFFHLQKGIHKISPRIESSETIVKELVVKAVHLKKFVIKMPLV